MKTIFTRMLCLAFALGLLVPNSHALVVLPAKPVSTEPDAATVKAAMESFRNLSKKEKKGKFRELKTAVKAFKAQKKAKAEPVASTLVQVIVTILLPPLGVYLHEGEINKRFWIDLILTLLFYVPGLVYGLIVVLGD
jgi:uncharacterized membrane protein YqaE (UPF0057 family)